MTTAKIVITLEETLLHELDGLVEKRVFANRSKAVQEALEDKLNRMRRNRLATECAKLDPKAERKMAEEGMNLDDWTRY
jgi:metal-responsive CopG/Arc/MetJ family transcriptional regulator